MEVNAADYQILAVDRRRFLAVAYGSEVPVSNRWQASPTPRGMSGGALIRIDGLPADPSKFPVRPPRATLSAIVTEFRKGMKNKPQVLLAARVGLHLGLIHQFLPPALTGLGDVLAEQT